MDHTKTDIASVQNDELEKTGVDSPSDLTQPGDEEVELNFDMEPEEAPYAPVVIKAQPANPTHGTSHSSPSQEKTPKFSSTYSPFNKTQKMSSHSAPKTTSSYKPASPSPTSSPKTPMPTATAPATISDFRRNADRQVREQKAVGNVLSWVGYALLAGLVLVAATAGFGGYVLWRMVDAQSVTVAQLKSNYDSQIATLQQTNQALQEKVDQTSILAAHNHDQITRVSTKADELERVMQASRQQTERDLNLVRSRDLNDLKTRVHRLEERP